MRRQLIGSQIGRHIHEHLVDAIHMNVFWSDVFQVGLIDLSVKRLQIDGYICPPLLLHLINYPKRTVQSYGKSLKITTFAP